MFQVQTDVSGTPHLNTAADENTESLFWNKNVHRVPTEDIYSNFKTSDAEKNLQVQQDDTMFCVTAHFSFHVFVESAVLMFGARVPQSWFSG